MSLLPMIFSNWWEHLDEPHSLLDQDFGYGIDPESLLTTRPVGVLPSASSLLARREPSLRYPAAYYRPWGELLRKGKEGGTSTVKPDKDQFHVVLDVQQFTPDEITVKVVDRFIVVEGNHEEKQDEHGWISRQFTRKYMIPEQCDIDQVASKLSSDGILSISVPRKKTSPQETERVIPIEHTGKPAVREALEKGKKQEEKKKEEKKKNDNA